MEIIFKRLSSIILSDMIIFVKKAKLAFKVQVESMLLKEDSKIRNQTKLATNSLSLFFQSK